MIRLRIEITIGVKPNTDYNYIMYKDKWVETIVKPDRLMTSSFSFDFDELLYQDEGDLYIMCFKSEYNVGISEADNNEADIDYRNTLIESDGFYDATEQAGSFGIPFGELPVFKDKKRKKAA